MADSKLLNVDGRTRLFDGSKAEEYWQWRRWMMGVLMADFPDKKSVWGPKILTHLRGEAERKCEDLELENIKESLPKSRPLLPGT